MSAVVNNNVRLSLGFAIAATFITVLSQISATDLTIVFGGLWLLVAILIFRKAGDAAVIGGYSIFLLLSLRKKPGATALTLMFAGARYAACAGMR